nr:hypothetical protein [Dyella sp. ASV24]
MKANVNGSVRAERHKSIGALPGAAERLIERFGELMTYEQLADLLKRSPAGLRISVGQRDSDFSTALRAARIKLGRRVYFRSSQIAALISPELDESGAGQGGVYP